MTWAELQTEYIAHGRQAAQELEQRWPLRGKSTARRLRGLADEFASITVPPASDEDNRRIQHILQRTLRCVRGHKDVEYLGSLVGATIMLQMLCGVYDAGIRDWPEAGHDRLDENTHD